MSRKCAITGRKPVMGSKIIRSGKAKKKGGIGMHVTAVTAREFVPNLHNKRIWVPELKKFVRVKVSARALKTIALRGAYPVLKEAGLV
jgi:large subunit ribosomal protein L28